MTGVSASVALTTFDALARAYASRGGNLSADRKRALDKALAIREHACRQLAVDPSRDIHVPSAGEAAAVAAAASRRPGSGASGRAAPDDERQGQTASNDA